MKASVYWKEVIWIVEDDNGKKYKVLISSAEPGHEYVKVMNMANEELTGDKFNKYVECARKAGI